MLNQVIPRGILALSLVYGLSGCTAEGLAQRIETDGPCSGGTLIDPDLVVKFKHGLQSYLTLAVSDPMHMNTPNFNYDSQNLSIDINSSIVRPASYWENEDLMQEGSWYAPDSQSDGYLNTYLNIRLIGQLIPVGIESNYQPVSEPFEVCVDRLGIPDHLDTYYRRSIESK